MRLTATEVKAIKHCFHRVDPMAKIYLFGSRVDDTARGGDINLLVFSNKLTRDAVRDIKLKLYDAIGERKIDVLIPDKSNQAFVNVVMKKAVLL